jgi:glycosidase
VGALSHFIEDLGIDGFRYDYVEGEALSNWAKVVLPLKQRFPETFHIAESFDNSGAALDPAVGFDAQWGGQSSNYGGRVNNYHQRLNCNLAESGYVRRYGDVVGSFAPTDSPMAATADVTTFHPGRGPWRDIKYLESHDERRLVEQVEVSGNAFAKAIGGVQKSRLGAISLFTCVGIPMLYHGQEIGVANPIDANPAPSPIDWQAAATGLRAWYRNLIQLRLNEAALLSDEIEFIWASGGQVPSAPDEADRILQYVRGSGDQAVLVVLNFDHEDHEVGLRFPAAGAWRRFDPASGSRDEILQVPEEGEVTLPIPASSGLLYLAPQ